MKKLMIAAAIVCAAAFAQAASFDWAAKYIGDDEDYYSGVLGRIFTTSDVTVEALTAELAAGNFDSWSAKGMVQKTTNANGTVAASDYSGSKDAGTYDFYAVFLDAATTGDATKFFITPSTLTKALVDGAGNETLVNFGDLESASAAGWQTIGSSVPEPTSGLLMLLGVAGLALRRKRA